MRTVIETQAAGCYGRPSFSYKNPNDYSNHFNLKIFDRLRILKNDDSVHLLCHQWFNTGTRNVLPIQFFVSKSQCSPATKIVRNESMLYAFPNFTSGSTRRITRKAVGIENRADTLCCSMMRKYWPGSGVRSGLPSYITLVAPYNSGP